MLSALNRVCSMCSPSARHAHINASESSVLGERLPFCALFLFFFSRAVFRAAPWLTERVEEATCIDERLAKRQGKNLELGHLNNVNRTLHFYLNQQFEFILSELSETPSLKLFPAKWFQQCAYFALTYFYNSFYFSFFCRSHSVCQITVERTRSKGSVKPAAEGRKAVNNSVLVFLEYRFLNTHQTFPSPHAHRPAISHDSKWYPAWYEETRVALYAAFVNPLCTPTKHDGCPSHVPRIPPSISHPLKPGLFSLEACNSIQSLFLTAFLQIGLFFPTKSLGSVPVCMCAHR